MKLCKVCGAEYGDDVVHCAACDTVLVSVRPAPDRLDVGAVVDNRFRVIRVLGEGAMGVVYRAVQLSVDREVALKVLKSHLASDEESVRRFLREARAATRLSNPHSVTVFDFGRTDEGMLYLAMELIEGRSLYDAVLAEAPLPERRAAAIALQICEALVEAHDKGIIHRDLKPENVSLCTVGGEPDYVKVLDFGIARFLNANEDMRVTATGMVVGTPCYMSPEQTRGHELDERTDLYAVGVMLFEMLSGELPFHGDSTLDLLLSKLGNDPPSLLDTLRGAALHDTTPDKLAALHVGPEMDDLVRRLMARDRSTRPGTSRAVIAELTAIVEAARHRPQVPPPSKRVERPPAATFNPDPNGTTVVQGSAQLDATLVKPAPREGHPGLASTAAGPHGPTEGSETGPETIAQPAVGFDDDHRASTGERSERLPAARSTADTGVAELVEARARRGRLGSLAAVGVIAAVAAIWAWPNADLSGARGDRAAKAAAPPESSGADRLAASGLRAPAEPAAEVDALADGGLATMAVEAPAAVGVDAEAVGDDGSSESAIAAALPEAPMVSDVTNEESLTVTLTSEPEGALVVELTQGGTTELGPTPVTLTGSRGDAARRLRLTKQGYEPDEVAVDLGGDPSRRIELRPIPQRRPPKPREPGHDYRPERLVNDPSELK